ncbi:thermonuclease family protein [Rothia sp. P5764]|uniref:thermonuclease family protein n=1 Tax=Rothia sp. P5764 TaxID=3402654 RepID=UPI003AC234C9
MRPHRYTTPMTALALGALTFTGCGLLGGGQEEPAEATPTATPTEDLTSARIISVKDADTIVVDRDGATVIVDLMNLATPQARHDNPDIHCLAEESTDYLIRMLPVGSPVELTYDTALGTGARPSPTESAATEPPPTVTAGVTLPNGKLVNAEIARAGYGVATHDGASLYYDQVSQAQDEADQKQAGLYSRDMACTLPAQLKTATNNLTGAQGLDLKDPLEEATQLTGTLAGYEKNPDLPLLASIVETQSVKTQRAALTRAHESKRVAYTVAEEAEREQKAKEASASPPPSARDQGKKSASGEPSPKK